jgi:tetratricopeptide (TPR) repeat protein
MKTKDRPRFDIAALREAAGEKVFARGQAYHRDGQVEILALERQRVLAQVAGTEDYRTVLTGRGAAIDGTCSCRAFTDWGFCKHMVAVALAANTAGADGEAEGTGALARIRAHLREKSVDALVDMILGFAERDPVLLRKLKTAAATIHADDKTLEAHLRKAIDSATRIRGFIDYGEAGGWAEGVRQALDPLDDLASGIRAGLALKLAGHAIDRIEQALESIDDSDGDGSALLHRARDIHLAAAGVARPDPVQLARDLFAREIEDGYDTFHNAVNLYGDMLGDAGRSEYRRLARAAWDKLPPRMPGRKRDFEITGDYGRLRDILDAYAESEGDVDARIALRAKDLSAAWNYLELAAFCHAEGRMEEALRHAEEGLWLFEDERTDRRLLFFTVELLSEAGRKEEAETHLWRAFEKEPDFDVYERLRKLGGRAARERAQAFLAKRIAKPKRPPGAFTADLLIEILAREKAFDAAWALVREHGASRHVQESLAGVTETTHPGEALGVYAARVEELAGSGGDRNYAEAAKLIARMAGLRKAAEQTAYVAGLKARHQRKRNFMKLLG